MKRILCKIVCFLLISVSLFSCFALVSSADIVNYGQSDQMDLFNDSKHSRVADITSSDSASRTYVTNMSSVNGLNQLSGSLKIEVYYTVIFYGVYRDMMLEDLLQAWDRGDDHFISPVGNWYQDLTWLSLTDVTRDRYSRYISTHRGVEYLSGINTTYCKYKLTYFISSEIPSVGDNDSNYYPDSFYLNDSSVPVNWNLVGGYAGIIPYEFDIDMVRVYPARPNNAYMVGDVKPYSVYSVTDIFKPYEDAWSYLVENHDGDIPDGYGHNVQARPYFINDSGTFWGDTYSIYSDPFEPQLGHASLDALVDIKEYTGGGASFWLYCVEFTKPSFGYGQYPITLEGTLDAGESYGRPANELSGYVGVWGVHTNKSSVDLNYSGAEVEDVDISGLYTPISFSLPEIDPDLGTWDKIQAYVLGVFNAIIRLVSAVFYNALIWIFCESPGLSELTKPLFLLALESGNMIKKFAIPFFTSLGVFGCVLVVPLIIGFVKSNR